MYRIVLLIKSFEVEVNPGDLPCFNSWVFGGSGLLTSVMSYAPFLEFLFQGEEELGIHSHSQDRVAGQFLHAANNYPHMDSCITSDPELKGSSSDPVERKL